MPRARGRRAARCAGRAPGAGAPGLQEFFAGLSPGNAGTTGAPRYPPMSEQLAAEIREALTRVERGQVVDLGSFAQYADDDSED